VELDKVLFFGCLNPKSGSFYINNRMMRFFTTTSCLAPEEDKLKMIFTNILKSHLMQFDQNLLNQCHNIIEKTCFVYKKVSNNPVFSPTTVKFH